MLIANLTTAANGSEREQILPLLDSVKLKTLKPGNPKRRVKILAVSHWLRLERKAFCIKRQRYSSSISQTKLQNQEKSRQTNKNICSQISTREVFCLVSKMQVVALSLEGNGKKLILMLSYFWLLFTFGLINY